MDRGVRLAIAIDFYIHFVQMLDGVFFERLRISVPLVAHGNETELE